MRKILSGITVCGLAVVGSDRVFASGVATGDIVVVRTGNGSQATGGVPVVLFDYSVTYSFSNTFNRLVPSGVTQQQTFAAPIATSGAVPTTGNRYLAQGATAAGEGGLYTSTNGQYMTFAGYNAIVGASLNAGSATTEDRVVGRLDLSTGVLDTSTALAGFSGSAGGQAASRGAFTTDGNDIWVALGGGSGSVRYTTFGTTSTTAGMGGGVNIDGTNNARRVVVYNNQLYESENANNRSGIEAVGTGTPTTAGSAAMNLLPGFSTTVNAFSPYDFFFANSTTLYVADDDNGGTGVSGLQKWTFDGSTWTEAYNHPITANGGSTGIKGLSGYVDADGNVIMFATTTGTGANFLMGLTDTLTNLSASNVSENTLVDASTAFGAGTGATPWNLRGVAIDGPLNIPEPASLSFFALTTTWCLGRRRSSK